MVDTLDNNHSSLPSTVRQSSDLVDSSAYDDVAIDIDGGSSLASNQEALEIYKQALGDDSQNIDFQNDDVDFNDDNQISAFKEMIDAFIGTELPQDLFEMVMLEAVENIGDNFSFESVIGSIINTIETYSEQGNDAESDDGEDSRQEIIEPETISVSVTSLENNETDFPSLASIYKELSELNDTNADSGMIDKETAISFFETLAEDNNIDTNLYDIGVMIDEIIDKPELDFNDFQKVLFFVEAISGNDITNETAGNQALIEKNGEITTFQDNNGDFGALDLNTQTGDAEYRKPQI